MVDVQRPLKSFTTGLGLEHGVARGLLRVVVAGSTATQVSVSTRGDNGDMSTHRLDKYWDTPRGFRLFIEATDETSLDFTERDEVSA